MSKSKSKTLEDNKTEEGIVITVTKDGMNPIQRPLSEFLKAFGTPKQRATVRTAIHSTLRMYGSSKKTDQEIAVFRASLLKDQRSTAEYWNGDSWGSISGMRDAENWVNTEIEKFKKS